MVRSSSRPVGPVTRAGVAALPPPSRRAVLPLRLYLCGLALLAPLRFGSVIGPAEIPLWPASSWEWLLGAWPPFLLGALAGIGLLWAVLISPLSIARQPAWRVLWVWLGLLAGCAPGLARTSEWDYALTFVLYLSGVCAFLAAVLLLVAADAPARRWLLVAIAGGTVLCGASGWYQRLWGFAEMRRYMEAQARETGRTWDPAMQGKILQSRVHRPFFHPNSYAAHLVLTGPLTLLLLWRAGRQVHPRRVSQGLFLGIGVVLVGGGLMLSQSRGAQLAFGGGVGLALLGFRPLHRWRWLLLAGAVAAGVLAMAVVSGSRDLLSASARLDYYRAAVRIFLEQPGTGAGLGEFLSAYVRVKPFGSEETRAAHNLVLEMLSQCGVVGGLAGLACALLPVWLSLRRRAAMSRDDELLVAAAVAGLGAWVLHALLDFNLQIPPTVTLAAVLPVFCWPAGGVTSGVPARRLERVLLVLLAAAATAAFWRVPGERAYRLLADSLERPLPADVERLSQQAARGLPLSPEPLALFGRELLRQAQPVAAAAAFRQALVRAPHRSSLHAWLAQASLLSGDLATAAAAAREAWERYPGSARAMVLNGLVVWLQSDGPRDPREAKATLLSGLSSHPNLLVKSDGLTVTLGSPAGEPRHAGSVPELCQTLSGLGLRTPGPTVLPVVFAAVPPVP